MELKQDLHIHTRHSPCCQPENTVEAVANVLDARGVLLAGLTDHINHPAEMEAFAEVVEANRRDLRAAPVRCRVLVGAEATMLAPNLCAVDRAFTEGLDFLIVSCNHYHIEYVSQPPKPTPEALANHHLDMILGAAELGYATTVAHPFFNEYSPRRLALEAMKCYSERRLTEVLQAAARAGLCFELNPYRVVPVLDWFKRLVQEARRCSARFTLGSDSHSLGPIGFPAEPILNGYRPHNPAVAAERPAPLTAQEVCDRLGLTPDDVSWPFTSRVPLV